jgi:hypothetical protein
MRLDPGAALALAVLTAALQAAPAGAAKLVPDGPVPPVAIEVAGRLYRYFPLTPDRPITVTVEGPSSFEAIARWRFDRPAGEPGARSPEAVEVELSLDGVVRTRHVFTASPGAATHQGSGGVAAGRPTRLVLDGGVPAGTHTVALRLVRPAAGTLDLNLLGEEAPGATTRLLESLDLALAYDSNAFRYSDSDLDDYLDGERPDRYPMESADDLGVEPTAQLALQRDEPGGRTTKLSLEAGVRLPVVNPDKGFARLSAVLREERDDAFVAFRCVAVPHYLIRDVWDPDAADGDGAYLPCGYAMQGFGAEVGWGSRIDLSARWEYREYRYDAEFIEYDAQAMTAGVTATIRPRRGLRVDLGYDLRQSVARGYDEDGETRATSDDSDTSHDQDSYGVRARWETGRLWGRPAVVTLRGSLARRFYLTGKSGMEDPYHSGRHDTYGTVAGSLGVALNGRARVEAFAEWTARRAHSDAVTDIGRTKDFDAARLGVRLTLEGTYDLD